MKIKTGELQGVVLNWAVAKCEDYLREIRLNRFKEWEDMGRTQVQDDNWTIYNPSEDWAQGGPIIERERINLLSFGKVWSGYKNNGPTAARRIDGPTPLIAAMRCYVASKMGDEIEIPDELAN